VIDIYECPKREQQLSHGAMKNVAVVCAFNPGNTGMHSVDLAASRFMQTLHTPHSLINFQSRPWRPAAGFQSLRNMRDLAKFTHVLFWGDFQNNPVYGINDFAKRELKFGYATSAEGAISNWTKLHLDISDRLHGTKIASIGNCFLGAVSAIAETNLASSLRNFVQNAASILPRETQSKNQLIDASGDSRNISTGLDTAFLLNVLTPENFRNKRNLGYCFARSGIVDVEAGLVNISKATGLSPVAIPWTVGDRKMCCKKTFSQALETIATCRVVVTDVYHLTVNAINSGRPVICLSQGDVAIASSVADSKKHALAEQIGISDLHVTLTSDRSLLSSATEIVEAYQLLMDRQFNFADVMDGLNEQRSAFRNRIAEIIAS
jgi:hypothetical protein